MSSVAENTRDITQRLMAKWRNELQQNAEVYANVRAQSHRSPQPNQIISSVGFTDHAQRLTITYYPPKPGTYKVYPDKKLRPWRYIALHVGDTGWDRAYFKRNTSVLPPGDDSGHNPERWDRLIKQYILPAETDRTATVYSTHYLVSRAGDVIASVDLNDIAYHMPKNFPKLFKDQPNNNPTVGIVFEPCYTRLRSNSNLGSPDSNLSLLEFSTQQQAALAVLIKKLTTVYPIELVVITRYSSTPLTELTKQNPTGIITTFGFSTDKTPTSPFLWPVPAPYQRRPPTTGTRFGASRSKAPNPHVHQGVDLGEGKAGLPVYAAAAGKIYVAKIALGPQQQYKPGSTAYGGPAFIWIRHNINGESWDTHYHHLDEATLPFYVGRLPAGFTLPPGCKQVPTGATIDVAAGQLIGYTAKLRQWPHLHFEIRKRPGERGGAPLDPMTMLGGENPVPSAELQRLFAAIGKVRRFNLATDVFIEKLKDPDFSEVAALAAQVKKGTLGQSMAALSAYNKLQGMRRASDLQTLSRSSLASKGVTAAASAQASSGQYVAANSKASNSSSVENVQGCSGGNQFDFTTGCWTDGKTV